MIHLIACAVFAAVVLCVSVVMACKCREAGTRKQAAAKSRSALQDIVRRYHAAAMVDFSTLIDRVTDE